MKDGKVFELEKDLEEAKTFLDEAEHHGFALNGRFHDANSMLTMQVFPPEEPLGFSIN